MPVSNNIKTPTKDVAKLIAVFSFSTALCIWSLLVWTIASHDEKFNINNYLTNFFLNSKDNFEVPLLISALLLFILAGTYYLIVGKRENNLTLANDEVIENTDKDKLTSLLNQNSFEKRVTREIEKIYNEPTSHALLLMNLDYLKVVNDTISQTAGDELISQIAHIIQHKLDEPNIVGRLWGDEFGIFLYGYEKQQVMEQAQTIIEAVNSFSLNWKGEQIAVGATIGFVMISDNSMSFPNLLRRASSACYLAKRNNRGNVIEYSQEHASNYQDMRLFMQIKHAIDQNQFMLYHQRILDITEDNTLTNASEILIRMKGEVDEKVLTPGIFLPVAERYNMMRTIDRWVIDTLFQHIHKHQQDLSNRNHHFYINLSGESLNDDSFYNYLTDKINEYNINTQLLCFEITETIAIQNLQNAAYLIGFLKRLGCSFALDDFGTGTSSFAYLKYLPIDYLKIDGVFIKDIANDPIDYEIVKAIKKICTTMKIKVIAELVEDEKTINFLKLLDIDLVQGHAIQKPIPLK